MADTNVKFLFGTETNFTTDGKKPANINGSVYFTTVDTARGYLYFGDGTNFLNIVPKLLGVPNGGTGRSTLDSGKALIGNGTEAVTLRSITNNTSTNRIAASTNLITANTLAFWNGAYNTSGNSRISRVGTIEYGTWKGSIIAVGFGGTGAQTLTSNGILYGAGTDAIQATSAGTQGQILSVNASGIPGFGSPSWSWTDGGASGPTLTLTIQDKAWTTAAIPAASGSISGIVITGTQTFAGIKTFSNTTASTSHTTGAVKISGGLGVAGNVYSNSNVVATGYGSFGGDIYAKGGEVYIGADSSRATLSYNGNTDTLTISFT